MYCDSCYVDTLAKSGEGCCCRTQSTKLKVAFWGGVQEFFWSMVTDTCSASWSLLWVGEAGQESCSSDEEWTSWSLSSIATGATVNSAISNQKGKQHVVGFYCGKKKERLEDRREQDVQVVQDQGIVWQNESGRTDEGNKKKRKWLIKANVRTYETYKAQEIIWLQTW